MKRTFFRRLRSGSDYHHLGICLHDGRSTGQYISHHLGQTGTTWKSLPIQSHSLLKNVLKDKAQSLWKSAFRTICTKLHTVRDLNPLNKSVHGTNLVRPLLDPPGGARSDTGAHKRPIFHRVRFPWDLYQITRFYLPEKRSHGVNPIRTSETLPRGTFWDIGAPPLQYACRCSWEGFPRSGLG